jgi:ABC-type lipoprotein release transport system permease subunit
MKLQKQFSFALKLIKAHILQYSLAVFGIFLGTASVFFFFSLTEGIKNGVQEKFTTEKNILTVQPNPQKNKIFQKKLSEKTEEKIQKISGVEKTYGEISLFIPSTISFPIPFFGDMMLDSYFIRGIDDGFFTDENFSKNIPENTTPVILSPLAIDFLNSFADSIPGFPGIKTEQIEGKNFSVEIGKSVFLPVMNKEKSQKQEFFVSGFSPMAPLLGIMIPMSDAKNISEFFGEKIPNYSRIHVVISDDSETSSISEKISEMGFWVTSAKEGSEKISQMMIVMQSVFLFSSILILILSILFLFSLLTLSVLEHHKTIGVLWSLGASKSIVRNIFIIQGGIISFTGSVLGMICGGIAIYFAEKFSHEVLPPLTILPESIFATSPSLVLSLFAGIFFVSLIAVVIPAHRASKKDPLLLILD